MKKVLPYIIIVILSIFIGYSLLHKNSIEKEYVIDTLYVHSIDTIAIIKPKPIYVEKIKTIIDTLPSVVDSSKVEVIIPIEKKVYKDTIYKDKDTINIKAVISGYKANLDTLDIEIYKVKQVINKINVKPKKFIVGPQIGITYDGKLKPFIGVGITYNLFSF